MDKRKSIIVTAICAVLLAALWLCLSRISAAAFAVLTAILATVGFGCGAVMFCRWLRQEPKEPVDKLDLPEMTDDALEPISMTYDQIKSEVSGL